MFIRSRFLFYYILFFLSILDFTDIISLDWIKSSLLFCFLNTYFWKSTKNYFISKYWQTSYFSIDISLHLDYISIPFQDSTPNSLWSEAIPTQTKQSWSIWPQLTQHVPMSLIIRVNMRWSGRSSTTGLSLVVVGMETGMSRIAIHIICR